MNTIRRILDFPRKARSRRAANLLADIAKSRPRLQDYREEHCERMDGALPIVRAGTIGLAIKFRPVRLIRLSGGGSFTSMRPAPSDDAAYFVVEGVDLKPESFEVLRAEGGDRDCDLSQ